MTSNSFEPPMISLVSLRMKALSSTTSTVRRSEDTFPSVNRTHAHTAVVHRELHRSPRITANIFRGEADASLTQRFPGCDDVALTDVHPRPVHQCTEHAGA